MSAPMPARVEMPSRIRWTLIALLAVGVLSGVFSAAAGDADRLWANWLLVSFFMLTLAVGGLFFVAVHYASGATWGVAIRRVPEALAGLIPLGGVLLVVALIAHPELYPWTHGEFGHGSDVTLAFKRAWLDRPFFLARAAAFLIVWTLFAWAIRRQSRLQDAGDADSRTLTNRRLSVGFLVVFAITFSLAGFDWVMSLEPGWYSTVFGVYQFAGLFLSTLALIILLVVMLERLGPLAGVLTDDHLWDLGKLTLGISTFWAYIWFCQYMLIWYTNIPEETVYFIPRTQGAWFVLFVMNVVLNWAVPFLALLGRDSKRRRGFMLGVAGVILLGRWVDLYIGILPPILGERPVIGVPEIGLMAGGIGLFGLSLAWMLRAAPIVPVGDPQLADSTPHHASPPLALDNARPTRG